MVVVVVRILGGFTFFELKAYDHVLTARLPEPPSDRVIVVEVARSDLEAQASGDAKNLTRDVTDATLIHAINQLKQSGAKVIGVDWYLPSETTAWTEESLAAFQPQTRAEFTGNQIITVPHSSTTEQSTTAIYGVCAQPYTTQDVKQPPVPAPNPDAIPSERIGFSNFAVDADGVLRRHLVGNGLPETDAATSPCQATVSFSALMALQYLGLKNPNLASTGPDSTSSGSPPSHPLHNLSTILETANIDPINALMYGGYHAIYPGHFELMLNYREPVGNRLRESFTHISIQDLKAGRVEPEVFKGKIVLLGLTAESYASDEFATPYGDVYGVTLQAYMVDHILSLALGERRQIWVWPKLMEWAWIVAWGIAGAMLGYWRRDHPRWLVFSLAGGLLIIYLTGRFTMGLLAGWIPIVPPTLGFVLSHGIVVYTDAKIRKWVQSKPN